MKSCFLTQSYKSGFVHCCVNEKGETEWRAQVGIAVQECTTELGAKRAVSALEKDRQHQRGAFVGEE